jgi:parallel beta-helix repeat protein
MSFMFLLTLTVDVMPVADLEGIASRSTSVVLEPEKRGMHLAGAPHGPIVINGDANFSDTAQQEGWLGDGSPENPFIIDRLDIDLGGRVGICITISNTQVNFIISNCILTGANSDAWTGEGAGGGIYLENVTNGELVNNTCKNSRFGISLGGSDSNTVTNNTCSSEGFYTSYCAGIQLDGSNDNTVANNTCNSNNYGITLYESDNNTVVNNACNNNNGVGIELCESDSNIVANNTCSRNTSHGIYLDHSHKNTVANNTCNSNRDEYHDGWGHGITLYESDNNTVVNNTCNNNEVGIYLYYSHQNTMADNICLDNTEHDIFQEFVTEEFDPIVLLLIGLIGITLLGVGWWKGSSRGDHEDIIVPTRYRLVSWFRKRRTLKHSDADEPLEPDSSDQ